MTPTAEFPFPAGGRIQFFVRTNAGAYWVDVDEEALVNGEREFSPIFSAANDVITQVRLNSPDQRGQYKLDFSTPWSISGSGWV